MVDSTLIDVAYETIERIERRKRKLVLAIMSYFLPAILCSAISAYMYIVSSHQKGGNSDIYIALIGASTMICAIFAGLAIKKLAKLNRLNNNLCKLEELEETICREVIKHQVD